VGEYQRIEYRIGKDGKITQLVLGGQGQQCVELTAQLEANLGKVETRELLPEYHLPPPQVAQDVNQYEQL
jgi:hypothetical protein